MASANGHKPLKWSEVEITFDESDCQDIFDLSGRKPILVKPTICDSKVGGVLMDGGSSSDILYASTLDAMEVPRSAIQPVFRTFHGAVPWGSITTIGQITLPVQLGTPENFRREDVLFDVVDIREMYLNAILGRPAIAKFMASMHYAYQCMKMPGPNGVITVPSSARHPRGRGGRTTDAFSVSW